MPALPYKPAPARAHGKRAPGKLPAERVLFSDIDTPAVRLHRDHLDVARLAGQILPMQPAAIEVQTRTGTQQPTSADEVGCFWISPIPGEDFRLRCRPVAGGAEVVTAWVRF